MFRRERHILSLTFQICTIVIGLTYGKITPIKYKYTDNYGNLFYECIVDDNENTKLIRSDNILSGNAVVLMSKKKRTKRYNRGSSMNPDGTRHVYHGDEHSTVGADI